MHRLSIFGLLALAIAMTTLLSGCGIVQCGEPEFCEIPTTNNSAITRSKGGGGVPGASF